MAQQTLKDHTRVIQQENLLLQEQISQIMMMLSTAKAEKK